MNNFWPSCGFDRLVRNSRGWLSVTPDYLRLFLARPELAMQEDSCAAEMALHSRLMDDPQRRVDGDAIGLLQDADARDNYRVFLDFRDALLAAAVVKGITDVSSELMLSAPPAGQLAAAGRAAGLALCAEGFADRRYLENGSLMPRAEPGAVITNVDDAVAQAMAIVSNGKVDSLCVHGDGPTAVTILQALRSALEADGLTIRSKLRD